MLKYTVSFARIGRKHQVPPVDLVARDLDDLTDKIHRFVGKHLASKGYSTTVFLDEQAGVIDGGRFGTFTLAPTPGWCPDECPRCEYRLKYDGYPVAHQSSVDGTICGFSWEPLS